MLFVWHQLININTYFIIKLIKNIKKKILFFSRHLVADVKMKVVVFLSLLVAAYAQSKAFYFSCFMAFKEALYINYCN